MRCQRAFSATLSVLCFVMVTGGAHPVYAEQVTYTDKLFGKTFVFTPEPDRIVIKFGSPMHEARVETVANQLQLLLTTPELGRLRYGVFSLAEGISVASMTELLALPGDTPQLTIYSGPKLH